MATPRAVLLGSIIIALALLSSAFMLSRQRYAIVQASENMLVRLDVVSGETVACVLHPRANESGDQSFRYPCNGIRTFER
jgi:hypothetical protein